MEGGKTAHETATRAPGDDPGDAAALPRGELKKEIQINLELLTEYLADVQTMRPDAATDDKISATDDVLVAALVTALYVRELTTRPRAPVHPGPPQLQLAGSAGPEEPYFLWPGPRGRMWAPLTPGALLHPNEPPG